MTRIKCGTVTMMATAMVIVRDIEIGAAVGIGIGTDIGVGAVSGTGA